MFEENYTNPKGFMDIFSFLVEEGQGKRWNYFGEILGVVRPNLSWNTTCDSKTIIK